MHVLSLVSCSLLCLLSSVQVELYASPFDPQDPHAIAHAMRAKADMERTISPWVDPRVVGEVETIALAIKCLSEPPCVMIPQIRLGDLESLDPGNSFGQMDGPLLDALTCVRNTYEQRRAQALACDPALKGAELDKLCRVRIMDLGAGHGFATWKFVVAGARVTVVEPQKSLMSTTTNFPWKNLDKAVSFLPEGVSKKDVADFVSLTAVQVLGKAHYQNTFDGVYAAHVLHCMSPREALTCTELLPGVLKDDGIIWARVLGGFLPNGHGRDAAVYVQQLAQKKRFPGYMMRVATQDGVQTAHGSMSFTPLDEDGDFAPRTLYREEGTTSRRGHFSFDPQSFKTLFEGRPFENASLFWEDKTGLIPINADEMVYASPEKTGIKSLYLKTTRMKRPPQNQPNDASK
ncbi:MAG: hypothetical protein C0514_04505 [Candidatus Puniceispirillum sp.]|nr:hypothetical protein [Candidatus Puniceispirillum sp.]